MKFESYVDFVSMFSVYLLFLFRIVWFLASNIRIILRLPLKISRLRKVHGQINDNTRLSYSNLFFSGTVYLHVVYLTTIFYSSDYRSDELWDDLRFWVYVKVNRRCSVSHYSTMFLESHGKSTEVSVPTEIRTKHLLNCYLVNWF
jgi:hypothetical protein